MKNWRIVETQLDLANLNRKETVFTIGNGYLATRGVFEESIVGEMAGSFVNGVYADIPLFFSELVNIPNWVHCDVFVDGQPFRMDQGQILSYRRELDLRNGLLTRHVRWQGPSGKTLDIQVERFASLADRHVLGLRYKVTPVDFSGQIELRAGINGQVDNQGWVHWAPLAQGNLDSETGFLHVRTRSTAIDLVEAFTFRAQNETSSHQRYWDCRSFPTFVLCVSAEVGQPILAEKLVVIYTSHESRDPIEAARHKLKTAVEAGFDQLLFANNTAWEREWRNCNVQIEGDDNADRSLRHSLFQLLIAAPRQDERVSIPAKALSGYAYRGHVFWDTEIFVLPFLIYTRPEIARNLLLYRFNTLPGARRNAKRNGFQGAMFAWESAATGDETTPRWIPGPGSLELIRIWTGDIEHHITADIAYAVMQYWRVAGDDDFLRDYGAELILAGARFWESRFEWNSADGYYELTDVIGPDEYHDHVDNNAYTNILARWHLERALEVLNWLDENAPARAKALSQELDLNTERLEKWRQIIERVYVPYDAETLLFEQFEGYFDLEDIDLRDYEPRTISMQALLGIKGAQKTQIIKQPDVLMMLYLLRDEGKYSPEVIEANWNYYTPRTDLSYGSSLGPAVQANLASRYGDIETAYQHFIHAARTDLDDVRGNAADGIHAATNGGLWQAAVFGFGGLRTSEDRIAAFPRLPGQWSNLTFSIQFRGQRLRFDLNPEQNGPVEGQLVPWISELPVQGVIFDLDGVLTDTSEMHFKAWKRLADEEGIPFTRQDNEALRGISRRESLIILLKGREITEEQMQAWMDRKNRYYQEMIAYLKPEDLLPGARNLLEEIKAAGIRVAIGSASKNARPVVEMLGIGSLVDAIADGFSVDRQKPAPDLFLLAAYQLGLQPETCIVFEDAEAGVEAALAGHMRAVGIGPAERVGKAQVVFDSLRDVTWEVLKNQFATEMLHGVTETE